MRRWHGNDGDGDSMVLCTTTDTALSTTTAVNTESAIMPSVTAAAETELASDEVNPPSTDRPEDGLTTLEVTSAAVSAALTSSKSIVYSTVVDSHSLQHTDVPTSSDYVLKSRSVSEQQLQTSSRQSEGTMSTPPAEVATARVVGIRNTSKQLSSSAVIVDGEVRHVCDHCPKSFKARRSMVHHRRMVHEGGRLHKKETTAVPCTTITATGTSTMTTTTTTTSTTTSTTTATTTDVGDDYIAAESEKLPSDDVIESGASSQLNPSCEVFPEVDQPVAASASSSSSVALPTTTTITDAATQPDAGVSIRQVYTCSFSGCSHTFKRPGQLHRHEEKHAGPGLYARLGKS